MFNNFRVKCSKYSANILIKEYTYRNLNKAGLRFGHILSRKYQRSQNQQISSHAVFSSERNAIRSVGTFQDLPTSMVDEDVKREFMAVFPDVVKELTEPGKYFDVPEITKWFTTALEYNVPTGRKTRGLTVLMAYRLLAPIEQQTSENIKISYLIGWCIELINAHYLILDDIVDESTMRRGKLCWYKNSDVGMNAINDALVIEGGAFQLLQKHISHKPYYWPIIEVLNDVSMKTKMGQLLDARTANSMLKFTMDRYISTAKYKTAYCAFYSPIAIAMHLAGINDKELYKKAETILLDIGHFYQVQDDYIDCYGDPEKTGKIGSDIQNGKCSWFIVVALQKSNSEQRKILEECYGSSDTEKISKVKKIYEELDLQAEFLAFEKEIYNRIQTRIQQISSELPHEVFNKLLQRIYKRDS